MEYKPRGFGQCPAKSIKHWLRIEGFRISTSSNRIHEAPFYTIPVPARFLCSTSTSQFAIFTSPAARFVREYEERINAKAVNQTTEQSI